jgi:PAS domain S-box-containing protein
MRTLLAAMADGMFVAQDERFVFANAALPRMLGHADADFIGLPFADVVAPDFLDLWTDRFRQRVGDGDEPVGHYELQFQRRDGSLLWVELRASRFDYRGRRAVLGLISDITQRRQAEQNLREVSELLQAVEDSVLDHMAVLDREGLVVAVNAAWTAFARTTHRATAPTRCAAPSAATTWRCATTRPRPATTKPPTRRKASRRAVAAALAVPAGIRLPRAARKRWFVMSVTPLRTKPAEPWWCTPTSPSAGVPKTPCARARRSTARWCRRWTRAS